ARALQRRKPMNPGSIVVGTDLGAASAEAIVAAGRWAREQGTALVVVHVAPDEVLRALEVPQVTAALRDRVDALLQPIGVPFIVRIEAGSPHAALVRVGDETRAELVV